jgi:hypothetical protein
MSLHVDTLPDGTVVVKCGGSEVRISPQSIPTPVVLPPLVPRDGEVLIQWVGQNPDGAIDGGVDPVVALSRAEPTSGLVSIDVTAGQARNIDIDGLVHLARRQFGDLIRLAINIAPLP